MEEIIKKITSDVRYKCICIDITRGSRGKREHLADDLYQEFMLAVLEMPDRIKKAFDEDYLEDYLVKTINVIWAHRDRIKTYDNGRTSNLYMICDNLGKWKGYSEEVKEGLRPDTTREITKKAVAQLHKKMNSDIEKEREEAKALWGACNSNVLQYAKARGVNHMKIKREADRAAEKISRDLNKDS